MQYITYFAGTRDDYSAFVPLKRARIGYRNAQSLYFDEQERGAAPPPPATFPSVPEELAHVLARLTREDIEHILVADLSPLPQYELKSVKVIIPRLELWFCPEYRPSPFFRERAERLTAAVGSKIRRRQWPQGGYGSSPDSFGRT